MPTDAPPPNDGWNETRWHRARLAVLLLFAALSLVDLCSPPITPTGLRQVQTFSQTEHFVAAGFSPRGLTLDIDGPEPFRVVYEFPLYQSIAGVLFLLFGPSVFWGKLVSLISALTALWLGLGFARRHWGEAIAWRAGVLAASSPIALLVSASFQPDAFALALGAAAGLPLAAWRTAPTLGRWLAFIALFSAAALAKFTVLVPFLPLLALLVFHRGDRWRGLSALEWIAAVLLFLAPFVAWNLHRGTLMDPRYLVGERDYFLIGNLRRFIQAGFYAKPAFILGAMALCGAGVPLALLGLRRLDRVGWALVLGLPVYFFLIPTAATQTYYAWPLVPMLALLAARGTLTLEHAVRGAVRPWLRGALAAAWLGGFAVAAPYTLRHDTISLAAAHAARDVSAPADLLFVINMHDRGVAIGAFNPTIITLAERRGWNVDFDSPDVTVLRPQIERRRAAGARWLVATWYSPDLEPWFTPLLPEAFARQPRFNGAPVDGRAIVEGLARHYPVAARGANYAVLRLD